VHETLRYNKGSLKEDWSEHLWLFDDIYLHHYADNTKSRSSYLPLLELRKQENPSDHYGRIYLAHEYFYHNMYEKSIKELTDILDNYSEYYSKLEQASCFLFMGDAYAALENYSAAVASY
jgi:tetratricopeptide (TPR) repeat protein